jgi:hypothetical protein
LLLLLLGGGCLISLGVSNPIISAFVLSRNRQKIPSTSSPLWELHSHSHHPPHPHRTPFITGNWKLNPSTKQEAVDLATGIANAVGPSSPGDVALFVPFPFLETVQKCVGDKLLVGAEVSDVTIDR